MIGNCKTKRDVDIQERLSDKALLSVLKRGIVGCNLGG